MYSLSYYVAVLTISWTFLSYKCMFLRNKTSLFTFLIANNFVFNIYLYSLSVPESSTFYFEIPGLSTAFGIICTLLFFICE